MNVFYHRCTTVTSRRNYLYSGSKHSKMLSKLNWIKIRNRLDINVVQRSGVHVNLLVLKLPQCLFRIHAYHESSVLKTSPSVYDIMDFSSPSFIISISRLWLEFGTIGSHIVKINLPGFHCFRCEMWNCFKLSSSLYLLSTTISSISTDSMTRICFSTKRCLKVRLINCSWYVESSE